MMGGEGKERKVLSGGGRDDALIKGKVGKNFIFQIWRYVKEGTSA